MDGTTPSIHEIERDIRLLMQRKENVIDLDILVEDARAELHAALERFLTAVAARDAEAERLAELVQRLAA